MAWLTYSRKCLRHDHTALRAELESAGRQGVDEIVCPVCLARWILREVEVDL
jgi:hypothetical protein